MDPSRVEHIQKSVHIYKKGLGTAECESVLSYWFGESDDVFLGYVNSVIDFFLYDGLVAQPPAFLFPSAHGLQTWTGRQQLNVLAAAAGAGGSGDPGERLLVGRGQVHHEEDAVRHILFGAGAGQLVLPSTAPDGGQQLAVPLGVLQVLQGDHVGQAQLPVQAKAASAAPHQEEEETEEEEDEGDGSHSDVGDGFCTDDGLAWALALWVKHKKILRHNFQIHPIFHFCMLILLYLCTY